MTKGAKYPARRAAKWARWTQKNGPTSPVRSLESSHILNILSFATRDLAEPRVTASSPLNPQHGRWRTLREIVAEARWRGLLHVGRTFRGAPLERKPRPWNERTIEWVTCWSGVDVTTVVAAAANWRNGSEFSPCRNLGTVMHRSPAFPNGVIVRSYGVGPRSGAPLPGTPPASAVAVGVTPSSTPPTPYHEPRACQYCGRRLQPGGPSWHARTCTRPACRLRARSVGQIPIDAALPPATTNRPTSSLTTPRNRRIVVED